MKKPEKDFDNFVDGRLIISQQVPPFSGAIAHITLEDTSYQDSESSLIAETTIAGLSHESEKTVVSFHLSIENPSLINEKHDYSVNVWINADGDGQASAQDLFNNENHPVLTHGFGNLVEIKIG